MAHNMYRVGDFVYFEVAPGTPYQIRKIEELNKVNQSGAVEAKVTCYYRRRDIPSNLLLLADKHSGGSECKEANGRVGQKELTELQSHRVRHRELFVSRQVETLPATHIRGKCVVSLLNETESQVSYLHKEDAFFYSLKYDPSAKTMQADRGEIRIGPNYQATIPELLTSTGAKDTRDHEKLAELEWMADNELQDDKVDEFWLLARSVGTMARAYDCTSSVRQPNLLMSAAAASRDATHLRALQVLHRSSYDFNKAVSALVPSRSPLLCRDEMEEWSASEGNLFEEAMDKYGKNFHDIRNDFLPWKTYPALVEYYYMWKTTDRYVQQKRIKAAEADTRLKQVYIPAYSRPSPAVADGGASGGRACECCGVVDTGLWLANDDVSGRCRVCLECWTYWKKYGGMKFIIKSAEGASASSVVGSISGDGSLDASQRAIAASPQRLGRSNLVGTTAYRVSQQRSFLFHSTPSLRVARRLCREAVHRQRLTRSPFRPNDIDAGRFVEEYETALSARGDKATADLRSELLSHSKPRIDAIKGQLLRSTVRRLHGGRDLGKWVPRAPITLYAKTMKRRLAPMSPSSTDTSESSSPPSSNAASHLKRPKLPENEKIEGVEKALNWKRQASPVKKSALDRLNGLSTVESSGGSKVRRSSGRSSGRDVPQKVPAGRRIGPNLIERSQSNGESTGAAGSASEPAAVTDTTLCEIYLVSDAVRKVRRTVPRPRLRKLTRQPFHSFEVHHPGQSS